MRVRCMSAHSEQVKLLKQLKVQWYKELCNGNRTSKFFRPLLESNEAHEMI